jgi:hypothetical protein
MKRQATHEKEQAPGNSKCLEGYVMGVFGQKALLV